MTVPVPDPQVLLEIYRKASLIKHNDERLRAALKSGRLIMPYYSARGQEFIPAALGVLLEPTDYLVTIYRGIHDMLAKGVPPRLVWAELAGKATGTCKGKGGPMHITHPESGAMVTTGIVGAGLPIATGLALAAQLRGEKRITWTSFGDGASNIGAFHEALNLASVWKLPVVFVCQNNRYAEHTSYAKGTSVERVADRAAAYSMPGIHVDGNDPIAMYAAAVEAVERARNGGGPTLIEATTFRFHGHVMGDDGHYIPRDEYNQAVADDPYPRFRQYLIDKGLAPVETLDAIDAEHLAVLDEAARFAADSPAPGTDELKRDVYAFDLA